MEIIKRKQNTVKNKTVEREDEDISPLVATDRRLDNVGVTSGSSPELGDSFIDVLGISLTRRHFSHWMIKHAIGYASSGGVFRFHESVQAHFAVIGSS